MDKSKNQKVEDKIAKIAFPYLVKSLYNEGLIKDEDLLNKDIILYKVRNYLADEKNEINFEIIVDHRDYLLEFAELENKNGNYELSITLYATYVEHTLNRIIHLVCISKKHDKKTQNEIIRNINISGKCTWLLKLLELPPIKAEHVKTILLISDERNSFIHYKWKPDSESLMKSKRYGVQDSERIKSLLNYLENYELELEFKGNKSKFDIL